MCIRLLSRTRALVGWAALACMLPRGVSASSVEVNPVRLELASGARGTVVMVKNQGTEPTRFQASVHTWAQDERGHMTLEPTQELFFFPSMLTLEPGESRPIRVGLSSAPAEAERAFRLIVEELPPLEPAVPTAGLKVLTRVSLPVFVAPKRRVFEGRIEDAEVRASRLRLRVRNAGTVNFFVRQARGHGLDAEGKAVAELGQPGWYVLAGGSQVFELEVPPEHCRKVRSVELEVETDQGVLRQTVAIPNSGAAPCAS
ncbi:fimbria/pilus periplasmic chaperone [Myxococcaceae bacterium JPH2]|nr:fimbria/pilus periplasmic chaperone [Myxococcaceae bacterium JPH2]